MKIIRCPQNKQHIRVQNYQVNKPQYDRLTAVGYVVSNNNVNGDIFTLIQCKKPVTDADLVAVRRLL
jgi:predicted metalloenzyme YecM